MKLSVIILITLCVSTTYTQDIGDIMDRSLKNPPAAIRAGLGKRTTENPSSGNKFDFGSLLSMFGNSNSNSESLLQTLISMVIKLFTGGDTSKNPLLKMIVNGLLNSNGNQQSRSLFDLPNLVQFFNEFDNKRTGNLIGNHLKNTLDRITEKVKDGNNNQVLGNQNYVVGDSNLLSNEHKETLHKTVRYFSDYLGSKINDLHNTKDVPSERRFDSSKMSEMLSNFVNVAKAAINNHLNQVKNPVPKNRIPKDPPNKSLSKNLIKLPPAEKINMEETRNVKFPHPLNKHNKVPPPVPMGGKMLKNRQNDIIVPPPPPVALKMNEETRNGKFPHPLHNHNKVPPPVPTGGKILKDRQNDIIVPPPPPVALKMNEETINGNLPHPPNNHNRVTLPHPVQFELFEDKTRSLKDPPHSSLSKKPNKVPHPPPVAVRMNQETRNVKYPHPLNNHNKLPQHPPLGVKMNLEEDRSVKSSHPLHNHNKVPPPPPPPMGVKMNLEENRSVKSSHPLHNHNKVPPPPPMEVKMNSEETRKIHFPHPNNHNKVTSNNKKVTPAIEYKMNNLNVEFDAGVNKYKIPHPPLVEQEDTIYDDPSEKISNNNRMNTNEDINMHTDELKKLFEQFLEITKNANTKN